MTVHNIQMQNFRPSLLQSANLAFQTGEVCRQQRRIKYGLSNGSGWSRRRKENSTRLCSPISFTPTKRDTTNGRRRLNRSSRKSWADPQSNRFPACRNVTLRSWKKSNRLTAKLTSSTWATPLLTTGNDRAKKPGRNTTETAARLTSDLAATGRKTFSGVWKTAKRTATRPKALFS